jgi:hypothetical protein
LRTRLRSDRSTHRTDRLGCMRQYAEGCDSLSGDAVETCRVVNTLSHTAAHVHVQCSAELRTADWRVPHCPAVRRHCRSRAVLCCAVCRDYSSGHTHPPTHPPWPLRSRRPPRLSVHSRRAAGSRHTHRRRSEAEGSQAGSPVSEATTATGRKPNAATNNVAGGTVERTNERSALHAIGTHPSHSGDREILSGTQ